jgi:hypothetical protein
MQIGVFIGGLVLSTSVQSVCLVVVGMLTGIGFVYFVANKRRKAVFNLITHNPNIQHGVDMFIRDILNGE